MKKNSHRPINVALYARSATGDGLDTQFARLASMIKDRQRNGENWVVTDTFVDARKSGATTDRPGYRRLLKLVRSGKINAVAVERLDRISRFLADFADFVGELDRRGVKLVSPTTVHDPIAFRRRAGKRRIC